MTSSLIQYDADERDQGYERLGERLGLERANEWRLWPNWLGRSISMWR